MAPRVVALSTAAPAFRSNCTHAVWPFAQALNNGVQPSLFFALSTSALAFSSSSTHGVL